MKRNSVYIAFVLGGALFGERVSSGDLHFILSESNES
jgi:hypothetical protein